MENYLNLLNPLLWFKWYNKLIFLCLLITIFLGIIYFYLLISIEIPILQQKDYYFIFLYLHVPCSWLAIQLYLFSIIFVLFNIFLENQLIFEIILNINTKIGFFFTNISLLSGMLWGLPTWGVLWVWDPRLTSMFILFLLYILYFVLHKNINKFVSYSILLSGAVNIPIIKYSVEWWNSLHQTASLTTKTISINILEYIPLIISISFYISILFLFYMIYFQIHLLNYKKELYIK